MTARFTLEMPEELLARVDEARKTPTGTVARNEWLRWAVEQALRREDHERALAGQAPAERPLGLAIQQAARSSRQAKDFKPYPKGKR